MNKLHLFRIVGESLAKVSEFADLGVIGTRKVDKYAYKFFKETSIELYPENLHRREWAFENMKMFYEHQCEEMQIMHKLQNKRDNSKAEDILEMIRRRKG